MLLFIWNPATNINLWINRNTLRNVCFYKDSDPICKIKLGSKKLKGFVLFFACIRWNSLGGLFQKIIISLLISKAFGVVLFASPVSLDLSSASLFTTSLKQGASALGSVSAVLKCCKTSCFMTVGFFRCCRGCFFKIPFASPLRANKAAVMQRKISPSRSHATVNKTTLQHWLCSRSMIAAIIA